LGHKIYCIENESDLPKSPETDEMNELIHAMDDLFKGKDDEGEEGAEETRESNAGIIE